MYFPLCQRNVLLRACTDIKETSVAWCAGRCADPDVVGAVGASLFASNIGSEVRLENGMLAFVFENVCVAEGSVVSIYVV